MLGIVLDFGVAAFPKKVEIDCCFFADEEG